MTTFYNFTLELKRLLSPCWKLEMPMILFCMSGLFISG